MLQILAAVPQLVALCDWLHKDGRRAPVWVGQQGSENHVRRHGRVELNRRMSITLRTATVASLDEVAEAVASSQQDGGPVQLHPGDLGWNWSLGAEALAGAVRVWRRDRQIFAVGLVEDAGLIRMGIAP